MTHELKGVEIFKVGRWNQMSFDEQALDDMVEAFEQLSSVHKVPLKFGHRTDAQIPKGQPAIGWVTKLWRDGKRLLADFSNVPTLVRNAFEHKLYRTVSIEMLMGARLGDKMFNHVLDAVALLGADQPAVHGLGDLEQFLAERNAAFVSVGRRLAFDTIAGKRTTTQSSGGTRMDQEIESRFAKLEGMLTKAFGRNDDDDEVSKLRKEIRDLKDQVSDKDRTIARMTAERTEFEANSKKTALASKRTEAKAVLENAVKAKAITPAARENFTKQYGLDDDAMLERLDLAVFKATFAAEVPNGDGRNSSSKKTSLETRPDIALNKLVKEYQAEHGEKDYRKAFDRVAEANPELHQEYLNMNRTEE